MFREIFSGRRDSSAVLPYADKIHKPLERLGDNLMYLLSIAVAPEMRGQGLATCLLDVQLRRFNQSHHFVSDVSNESSLGMYRKRNFEISTIDDDYFLVCHECNAPLHSVSFEETIKVFVPEDNLLGEFWPCQKEDWAKRYLPNVSRHEHDAEKSFSDLATFRPADKEGTLVPSRLLPLSQDEFYQFQRYINLSICNERYYGDAIYYESNYDVKTTQLYSEVLQKMLPSRKTEWAIVPDTFISSPMKYESLGKIEKCIAGKTADEKVEALLRLLDFRTQYEAGIPNVAQEVDSFSSFKDRIKRYYLGKVVVQIFAEVEPDNPNADRDPIGAPAYVDLLVTVDTKSNCAVLTCVSLSTPFLISHLLDNVIRNQLYVCDSSRNVNFYDYVSEHFGLVKRGMPKMYVLIPKGRECMTKHQIASLLVAETIYPDGELFGRIIDSDIVGIAESENGMGQYDRATVLAHTNVVLQFGSNVCQPVGQRIDEASIVLFYIELILIEEAAIHIADHEIEQLFFLESAINDPQRFLQEVDKINDDYYKTMAFWDLQLNYPTSRKSIKMLRDAFAIREQLEYMQRNQTELKNAFETKSDLIDRKEANRVNVALAVLSVLAVFSALTDSHQYIETWENVFSHSTINIVQRVTALLIIITVGAVMQRLFGPVRLMGRLRELIRTRHQKHTRKAPPDSLSANSPRERAES